jgi:hypothetical protein
MHDIIVATGMCEAVESMGIALWLLLLLVLLLFLLTRAPAENSAPLPAASLGSTTCEGCIPKPIIGRSSSSIAKLCCSSCTGKVHRNVCVDHALATSQ